MITYQKDGTIILNGIEQGIADNPYDGIADIRNVNLISIPKEGNVNFSNTLSSYNNTNTINILSADAGADTITISSGVGNGSGLTAVVMTGGSLPAGLSAATTYWLAYVSSGVYNVYSTATGYVAGGGSSLVNITSSGTGTLTVINMDIPKNDTIQSNIFGSANFIIDNSGRVWTNFGSSTDFKYAGNTINTPTSHGNGIGTYNDTINNISYLFVFQDDRIDYAKIESNTVITWTYGWKPSTGTSGNTNYLKAGGNGSIHKALVGSDNVFYYCDGNWVSQFYQKDPTVAFDPTNTATYIFTETLLLPSTDTATCITQLGTNLLIGGTKNVVYPWDRKSNGYQYPIFLAENYITNMVTINTNTFVFAGNRGRIYLTNGSQANLFKKIPDHIVNSVEPFFTWRGATSLRNQLYFSFSTTTNGGSTINTAGGIWAIDLDTQALRMVNKLSYNTYAGYASVLAPAQNFNNQGAGLVAGWYDGVSVYGIDLGSSSVYGSGLATIDYDIIPAGTYFNPETIGTIEFKLSQPTTLSGSIKLQYRQNLTASFADIDSTVTFASGILSGAYTSFPFEKSQWLQLRAVMGNEACHLTEVRINKN